MKKDQTKLLNLKSTKTQTKTKLAPAEKEAERQGLIAGPEELIKANWTDAGLDKRIEKDFLIKYREQNPKRKYVLDQMKPYLKKFPMEYYKEIYRLLGWPINEKTIYRRPGIVGKWTNEIIYCRFPEGTLKALQDRNPPGPNGKRMHKHFQWLDLIGERELKTFISDAVRIMKSAKYWTEFKRLMAKEFNLPYQGDLFES